MRTSLAVAIVLSVLLCLHQRAGFGSTAKSTVHVVGLKCGCSICVLG